MNFHINLIKYSKPLATAIIAGTLGTILILPTGQPETADITAAYFVGQTLRVPADAATTPVVRDSFTVTAPPPKPVAPVATAGSSLPRAVADPGSAQAVASDLVAGRGWGQGEFDCLVALWNRESGWDVNAYNPSSGAGGIPQSLPASKMASAGADWETNPATQIKWGLGYIEGRYGSPCSAWAHSENVGWY